MCIYDCYTGDKYKTLYSEQLIQQWAFLSYSSAETNATSHFPHATIRPPEAKGHGASCAVSCDGDSLSMTSKTRIAQQAYGTGATS